MTRRFSIVPALVLASAIVAAPTAAASTQGVSMTFAEPLLNAECTVPIGFCGSGEVIPLGQATETLDLIAGTRTITFADGSITLAETLSNLACPGACSSKSHRIAPVSAELADVVIGGTGRYAEASGTLTGTVLAAGLIHIIQLSGWLDV